ncbi:MAG: nuclear transport factor 2 family protein [Terriglobales bacterium]
MKLFCSVLFLVVLFPSLNAQAPAGSADERKLLLLENAWNMAQLHHDAKSLASVVGEKFVYTDYDGSVMDKKAFLADVQDPEYKPSVVANENVKVDLYPNAAVVSGTYHSKGTYKGKAFDHRGRFTDMWIYQNTEWHCVASHTTLLHK